MSLKSDPSKFKISLQSLVIILIIAVIPLGYWLGVIAETPRSIIPGAFILAVVIALFVIYPITFHFLSKGGRGAISPTHLPKVNVVFDIPDASSVKLDYEKCTYKIYKINAKDVSGKASAFKGPGGWQITIPQDISSDNDTIELRLVERSGRKWTIGRFRPHVTTQKAIDEAEQQ